MNSGETYFNIYYLSPTCSVASATVITVLYKNTDKYKQIPKLHK
jgi:hypothetical protein